ncbi:hypothetical protein D3C76_1630140 [compost metagenome]
MLDIGADHGLNQGQRGSDVVLVVLAGLADRLAHLDEGREMEDRVEVVIGEQPVQCTCVGDIQLDPFDIGRRCLDICHHHFMSVVHQVLDHV